MVNAIELKKTTNFRLFSRQWRGWPRMGEDENKKRGPRPSGPSPTSGRHEAGKIIPRLREAGSFATRGLRLGDDVAGNFSRHRAWPAQGQILPYFISSLKSFALTANRGAEFFTRSGWSGESFRTPRQPAEIAAVVLIYPQDGAFARLPLNGITVWREMQVIAPRADHPGINLEVTFCANWDDTRIRGDRKLSIAAGPDTPGLIRACFCNMILGPRPQHYGRFAAYRSKP